MKRPLTKAGKHRTREASVVGPTAPLGVVLGYAEFFGKAATWQALEAHLRLYPLHQLMEILGRISAVLEDDKLPRLEQQTVLVRGVFAPSRAAQILGRLRDDEQHARTDPQHAVTVAFDETSVLGVLKAACWIDRAVEPPQRASLQELGEALLMVNDLTEHAGIGPGNVDVNSPEGIRRWAYYATVNLLFRRSERYMHALARAYELYLADRPHLRDTSDAYIDLPQAVRDATGLEPMVLWGIMFGLLTPFATISPATAHEPSAFVNRRTFFASGYDIPHDEVDRFFDFMGQAGDRFVARMRQLYSREETHPFSALPLSEGPLITVGDFVFAPYIRELFARLTLGMHYRLLDACRQDDDKDRFQRYIGHVFEDYIAGLFRRVFSGTNGKPRFLDGRAIAAAAAASPGRPTKHCDGMIIYRDAVVIFETKAKLLRADARNGHNEAAFFEKLEDTVVRGARQLDQTAEAIVAGRFASLGLSRRAAHRIYPIVVSLQPFPSQLLVPEPQGAPLYRWITERLQAEGLLRQPGVRPLQLMDASECEDVEARLIGGDDLRAILDVKLDDPLARVVSFQQYLHTMRRLPSKPTNPLLDRRYRELTAAALAYFDSRRLTGESDGPEQR